MLNISINCSNQNKTKNGNKRNKSTKILKEKKKTNINKLTKQFWFYNQEHYQHIIKTQKNKQTNWDKTNKPTSIQMDQQTRLIQTESIKTRAHLIAYIQTKLNEKNRYKNCQWHTSKSTSQVNKLASFHYKLADISFDAWVIVFKNCFIQLNHDCICVEAANFERRRSF